jgi:ankyrin repeat protein
MHTMLDYLSGSNPNVDILEYLLKNVYNNNDGQKKFIKLLNYAVTNENYEPVENLLNRIILMDMQDEDGQAPIHVSAGYVRNVKAIELILEKTDTLNIIDKEGRNPIHSAALNKNSIIMEHILKKNENLKKENQADINAGEMHGLTPLHIAALNLYKDTVKTLLEHNALTAVYEHTYGDTPLHTILKYAINWEAKEYTEKKEFIAMEISDLLLRKKAPVNATNFGGQTPLHVVMSSKNADLIDLLLHYKPDLEKEDLDGCTALVYATDPNINACDNIVINLVKGGANYKRLDVDGIPLWILIERDYPDAWKWMMENGYVRNGYIR